MMYSKRRWRHRDVFIGVAKVLLGCKGVTGHSRKQPEQEPKNNDETGLQRPDTVLKKRRKKCYVPSRIISQIQNRNKHNQDHNFQEEYKLQPYDDGTLQSTHKLFQPASLSIWVEQAAHTHDRLLQSWKSISLRLRDCAALLHWILKTRASHCWQFFLTAELAVRYIPAIGVFGFFNPLTDIKLWDTFYLVWSKDIFWGQLTVK